MIGPKLDFAYEFNANGFVEIRVGKQWIYLNSKGKILGLDNLD